MRKLVLTIFLFVPLFLIAQITAIPDTQFEQKLINLGIDSDATVNGQLLTADAYNVSTLNLGLAWGFGIQNFSGIEAFVNLEHLEGYYNGSLTINMTTLTKLKNLIFPSNALATIDLSKNVDLETLSIGNDVLDSGQFNAINELDLSSNSKLEKISVYNLYTLKKINLRNHNADSLRIVMGNDTNDPYNICIEVDDPIAATNGTAPYDTWTIIGNHYFNQNCALSVEKFVIDNFKIYPNPATEYVSIEQKTTDGVTLQSVQILDSSGKWIRSVKDNFNQIDVSNLSKGIYLFVIQTDKGNKTEKIIIK